MSLGEYKSHATTKHSNIVEGHGQEDMPTFVTKKVGEEPEERSPEYVRRKYFPSALAGGPSLSGSPMRSSPAPLPIPHHSTGTPIPPSVSLSLPTLLGLHHHAEGS